MELAVALVVGSGLFICSVSLASVIFVRPIEIKNRVAFVRSPPPPLLMSHTKVPVKRTACEIYVRPWSDVPLANASVMLARKAGGIYRA